MCNELYKFTAQKQPNPYDSYEKFSFVSTYIDQSTVNTYIYISTTSSIILTNIEKNNWESRLSKVEHQHWAKYNSDRAFLSCRYDRLHLIDSGSSSQSYTNSYSKYFRIAPTLGIGNNISKLFQGSYLRLG